MSAVPGWHSIRWSGGLFKRFTRTKSKIERFKTLRKTSNTNRPMERFSVLIVPRNRSKIRRFECSRRAINVAIAIGVAFMFAVVSGVLSLVHYWEAYRSTEDVRIQGADFAREKAGLYNRLSELEAAVERTERFAAKIESAVGKSGDGLSGHGPVDEEDGLPSTDLIKNSNAISLGGSVWKSPFSKSLSADLNLSIDELLSRSDKVEERVHSVFALKQDKAFFWASLPSTWPAHGWVTSEFGEHRGWRGRGRLHEGVDIAGPVGTPIQAPGDGVITFVGYSHGYGQMIRIDHGYGITTLYGHCSALYVQEGQRVRRGMLIAAVGNTGSSTGPHLHYEVHVDGVPVNPMMYVMR